MIAEWVTYIGWPIFGFFATPGIHTLDSFKMKTAAVEAGRTREVLKMARFPSSFAFAAPTNSLAAGQRWSGWGLAGELSANSLRALCDHARNLLPLIDGSGVQCGAARPGGRDGDAGGNVDAGLQRWSERDIRLHGEWGLAVEDDHARGLRIAWNYLSVRHPGSTGSH